jgi:hypothetical protein
MIAAHSTLLTHMALGFGIASVALIGAGLFEKAISACSYTPLDERRKLIDRRISKGSPAPLVERRRGRDRRRSI